MKSLKTTFWALIGTFLFIFAQFFIPAIRDKLRGSLLFLLPFALFFLLGAILAGLTIKEKVEGNLKKFLLLTGISASGFFISIILHNLIYGLFIALFGHGFWGAAGLGDEPVFFLIALFACPAGFLIGAVGSALMLSPRGSKTSA